MNVHILTASFLLATSFATAQSQVFIDQGGIGCAESGALLDDGSPASAQVDFDYDAQTAQLRVTIANTTPVLPGVLSPTITRVYFNAPTGTLTAATLIGQFASGPTQPAFVFGFDADAGDGDDPNRASCFGSFNFRLASGGIKDGIANEGAEICSESKEPPLTGPVTFVIQLVGPEVDNLRGDVFAASSSHHPTTTSVNVAVKFDGADCTGSGTIGNGDVCRQAVFLRGTPRLGETVRLCVEGGQQCRAWLGVSAVEGPASLKKFTMPIGMPVLFTHDFGFFPVNSHEFELPVFVPFAVELVGLPIFMTSLNHPFMQEGPYGFAPAYSFSVLGGQQLPQ